MGVRCSNCARIVKELCADCWKCDECCDCKFKTGRKINGKIDSEKPKGKKK